MNSTSRANARLQWTRAALGDPSLVLESASADASFRSYWRTTSGSMSWIVMDAPPALEDITPWLAVAQRLTSAGLRAPLVRASDTTDGFVLMSDLGTRMYLPELFDHSVDSLYAGALDALLTMATDVSTAALPDYHAGRLMAEMQLMPEWFLRRHLGIDPDSNALQVLNDAFGALVQNAIEQPQVFVHRDYHSRNLLILPDSANAPSTAASAATPGIIDFQDAVRGPVTYDPASLLRDCYIAWPEARVRAWVESHRQQLEKRGVTDASPDQFRRWFDLTGLQRHIKVLGIFCRLWYRDGKSGYLGDLPLVWRYTREVGACYPETAPLIELLQCCIGSRDITVTAADSKLV